MRFFKQFKSEIIIYCTTRIVINYNVRQCVFKNLYVVHQQLFAPSSSSWDGGRTTMTKARKLIDRLRKKSFEKFKRNVQCNRFPQSNSSNLKSSIFAGNGQPAPIERPRNRRYHKTLASLRLARPRPSQIHRHGEWLHTVSSSTYSCFLKLTAFLLHRLLVSYHAAWYD